MGKIIDKLRDIRIRKQLMNPKSSCKNIRLYIVSLPYDIEKVLHNTKETGKEAKLNTNIQVLTITSTYAEAAEYVDTRWRLDNTEHFISWCNLHNVDYKAKESWEAYLQQMVENGNEGILTNYLITVLYYPIQTIAEIFRGYLGCVPIGCSFDTKEENKYSAKRMGKIKDWNIEETAEIKGEQNQLK